MDESTLCERYKEIANLGKGRSVWLVLDRESKKVYVKKRRQEFNESVYHCIQQIRNPHIPRIISCQEEGGVLTIIEEYIAGETLLEKMEQGVLFSAEEIKDIMLQLCEGVECLHGQPVPIIHRDIKPSNIMISSDGVVKLIDYNTARHYDETRVSSDTQYMGTPGYAAPEQYGFSQSDMRTDIYAMGVVLNYLLTGRHILEQTAGEKLGKVVKKCIQMDPQKRYQSVSQIKAALGRYGPWFQSLPLPPYRQKGIWPIPGFRTGKIWKMYVAIVGYCYICLISMDTRELRSQIPILWAAEGLCKMMSLLSIVAIVTDYKGIQKYLPLVNADSRILRWVGCAVWGGAAMFVAVGIYLLLEQIILLFI